VIWDDEPDTLDFEYETLPCAMRRNHSGAWCGYVGIPKEHPLHGVDYGNSAECLTMMLESMMDKPMPEKAGFGLMISALGGGFDPTPETVFEVHGGLTWSGANWPKEDGHWWYGFDCSHAGDLSPKHDADRAWDSYYVYRDATYVRAETESLARQLLLLVA